MGLQRLIGRAGLRYDTFISYARDDTRAYALALRNELERRKLTVFLDQDDLKPGDPLSETLRGRIGRSRSFILLDSRRSRCSTYVREEVDTAVQHDLPIMRVLFNQADGGPCSGTNWFELPQYEFLQRLIWHPETREIENASPSDDALRELTKQYRVVKLRTYVLFAIISVLAVVIGTTTVVEVRRRARATAVRLTRQIASDTVPVATVLREAADVFSSWRFGIYSRAAPEEFRTLQSALDQLVVKIGPRAPSDMPPGGNASGARTITKVGSTTVVVNENERELFTQTFDSLLDAALTAKQRIALGLWVASASNRVMLTILDVPGGMPLGSVSLPIPPKGARLTVDAASARVMSDTSIWHADVVLPSHNHLVRLDALPDAVANPAIVLARLTPDDGALLATSDKMVVLCRNQGDACETVVPRGSTLMAKVAAGGIVGLEATPAGAADPTVWVATVDKVLRCWKATPWHCDEVQVKAPLVPRGSSAVTLPDGCRRIHKLGANCGEVFGGRTPMIPGTPPMWDIVAVDGTGDRGVLFAAGLYYLHASGSVPRPLLPADFVPTPGPALRITSARFDDHGGFVMTVDDPAGDTVYHANAAFGRMWGPSAITGLRAIGDVLDARPANAKGDVVVTLERWGRRLVTRRYYFTGDGFAAELRQRSAAQH